MAAMPNHFVARAWDRVVLPCVTDLYTRPAKRFRKELLGAASGRVLELGIGSGPSIPFYSAAVTELIGLEPNVTARAKLERNLPKLSPPFPVQAIDGSAEALPFPDAAFDSVSFQLVLCTLPHPERGLAEALRVLRPGGKLLYIEHVRHSHPKTARLQDRLTPPWRVVAGGCRLNQDTPAMIADAGFQIEWQKEVENESRPHFLSRIVWGVAIKPAS
jgi:ubiquinone/menaquinone biosynthesis C-methylase UbiE